MSIDPNPFRDLADRIVNATLVGTSEERIAEIAEWIAEIARPNDNPSVGTDTLLHAKPPGVAAPAPASTSTPTSTPVWSDAHRQRVTELIAYWQPRLLLHGHNIDITYSDIADKDSDSLVGQMVANHPYIDGHTLTLYPSFITDTPGYQSRVILHELLHIVTSPAKHLLHEVLVGEKFVTWREVKGADERSVDMLTSIIIALLGAG